ncbi:MAG: DUF294 nucleotidyltransferase-like domain-containing protein [Desulfuromonadales bacterium]|nr:DUF294 nucleotidyltransferase-like domain-containing protein [Desulfuromonadales bacterium]
MSVIKQLQETEPFNQLPQEVFAQIRAAAQLEVFPKGINIFSQNAKPTGFLYVIKGGLVEVIVHTPGGGDMVVDYRREGDIFGGTPIFTGEPYTGGARTVKATECYLIPESILQQVSKNHPQLRDYFTRMVLSRVKNLYSDIVTEHSRKALTQMEAFPFQKRLSEIMSVPVETCGSGATGEQIAIQMVEKNVGSVVVVDEYNAPIGIVTERDLIVKVIATEKIDRKTIQAHELMSEHVYSMPPDSFMYEAMSYMIGHRIKYLPIVDRDEIVGIVTQRDLMRFRSQKAMLLVGAINDTNDIATLARIKTEIATVAQGLLSETRSTPEVLEIISYIHHGIIRRVYDLCHAEMLAEGYQQPDIRFAFMIMGSGGRREMLLGPDQDNAFIYEDVPDERMAEIDAFFVPFADKIVTALEKVGYPLCNGEVMVNNPEWRGRISDWHNRIHKWVNAPEPQRVRNSSIFFDFTALVGDSKLATDLRTIVNLTIRQFPAFLFHMMSLDLSYKVPIGLLGRFILDKTEKHKGHISVKQGGSIYIVDCVRMFALEHELTELTTLDRLTALVKRNVFAPETAEHIRAALEALNFLRLRNEITLAQEGKIPTHFLDPYALSKPEQDLLKEALHAVSKLQDSTKRHFGRGQMG